MNKNEWLKIINDRQDMYVDELFSLIKDSKLKKTINFNSPTGTGKTIMISKLIKKMDESNYFFIITTLSRGGLNKQVYSSLNKQTNNSNFIVFGINSYTASTKLQGKEILSYIPKSKEIIWIRDEGHIKSNNWTKLLEKKAFKIINVSATNEHVDIQCNFMDTPLLRTPYQMYGTPEEAIRKLMYVKNIHKNVLNYNPCLIVRDVNGSLANKFVNLCNIYKLKLIDITDQSVNIQKLCENDNEYDVIINKMKIVEGIDIPRASVIYIGNRPNNDSTIIQLIGRVRRNALLWNDDIDIFEPKHHKLLKETSKTYVFYNKSNSAVKIENGELVMELSDTISIEQLLPKVVSVKCGKLQNGYKIAELSLLNYDYSGELILSHKEKFVKITNLPNLYKRCTKKIDEFGTVFKAIIKDSDLVMVSFDKNIFTKINNNGYWRISTTVSHNIKYGKLYKFINDRYKNELLYAIDMITKTKTNNHFFNKNSISKKIKKCMNYIVKYYIKYLMYGKQYIEPFYDISLHKFNSLKEGKYSKIDVEIYAICLCYKSHMNEFYGANTDRLIPTLSELEILELPCEIKDKIKVIAEKGLNTIMPIIHSNQFQNGSLILCPHMGNRNILHGVADIVTETSIIQMTLSENIKQEDLYKGFALHFLSTKRYDLQITNVIFLNLNTNKIINVKITSPNLTKLTYIPAIPSSKKREVNTYYKNDLSSLKVYFANYGKQMTLQLINDYSDKLSKQKQFSIKIGTESKLVTQKQLLKSAYLIKDKDIDKILLQTMKPSIDTLEYAVNSQNYECVKILLLKVKPNKKILDIAIKNKKIDIIEEIIHNTKVDISNLITAIKTQDEKIIDLVSDNFTYSRNVAKLLIRTKNEKVINKLFNYIVPTTSNLVTAIKTNNLEIIKIVVDKIPNLTFQCVEVAKATKNNEIIDFIGKKLYNKNN